MAIKKNNCPICNCDNVYITKATAPSIGSLRHICICSNCNHIWRCPLPTIKEIQDHYRIMEEQSSKNYDEHNNRRLQRLSNTKAGAHLNKANSILEIGPGKRGILPITPHVKQYSAIELSEFNKRELLKQSGSVDIKVFNNITKIDQNFECAVLISLLEHVISPNEVVKNMTHKIKQNGSCIIGVPKRNLEIFNFEKIFTSHSINLANIWSDGDHLHSFTEDSMRIILEQNNLQIISIEHIGMDKFLTLLYQQNKKINELLQTGCYYSFRKILSILARATILRAYHIFNKNNRSDYLTVYTATIKS